MATGWYQPIIDSANSRDKETTRTLRRVNDTNVLKKYFEDLLECFRFNSCM